jgi:hypothetical protein
MYYDGVSKSITIKPPTALASIKTKFEGELISPNTK